MRRSFLTFTLSAIVLLSHAQDNALTIKDYQRAENLMGYNTQKYVDRGNITVNWIGADKFWYRVLTPQGSEFIIVNAAKGTKAAAFDQQKLATALSSATGRNYTAAMLPFQSITYSDDGNSILFRAAENQWKYNLQNSSITADTSPIKNMTRQEGGRRRGGNEVLSPDGNKAAYIKDFNLWVKDVKTGKEIQLTTDGIKDFGYATDNAGWSSSDRPVNRWSP